MKYFTVFVLLGFFFTACTYDQFAPAGGCDTPISLELITVEPASCEFASGAISVRITNSEERDAAAEFSLDGITFQSSGEFGGLSAGSYNVRVKSGPCTAELPVTVENIDGLNAELILLPSDCGANTGTISVNVNGAVGAVEFSLNDGPGQASADFTGLAPGEYTVKVSDAAGCNLELQGVIASTIGYDNVESIITQSCALSGCHAGNVSPDFRVKDNIIAQSNRILSRTSARTMPPNSSGITLSEAEIDAISCWVADGAPE